MLRFEFQKLLRHRALILIVTLALTAYYIFMAFYGAFNTYGNIHIQTFWESDVYRDYQKSQKTEVIDEAWIDALDVQYREFIDTNMLPPDQIQANIDTWKAQGVGIDFDALEALEHRYDIDYAIGLLDQNTYHSMVMEYKFFEAYHIYIPLSRDPVGYLRQAYEYHCNSLMVTDGITYAEFSGYSEAQMEDCWKTIEACFPDIKMVIGYCLGWDVLCGVMQYLPFCLGLALILVLGSLFSQEQISGMTPILRTLKLGRGRLLRTKLITALTVASALWVFFQGAMLIVVALTYGLDGASCTVMQYREPSIYGLNWGTFYLIQCVLSFFGTQVFALFVCFVSSLMKPRLAMPVSLVVTLLTGQDMAAFLYSQPAYSTLDKVVILSPAQLMASYPALQIYQSYEFGPIMIQLPHMMALAMFLEAAVMLFILSRREGGK